MKTIIMTFFLILVNQSFGETNCVDKRVAFFAPCSEGQERIYEQGQCKELYEVEKTYCKDIKKLVAITGNAQLGPKFGGMQEVIIRGKAVLADKSIALEQANLFTNRGFVAMIEKNSDVKVGNCSEGVYVITAGEGNVLPSSDGTEMYSVPSLISFACIND